MRRRIPASVAVFALVLAPAFLNSLHAQTNGVPSSVTSSGFGGRTVNGTPASVTSLGPRGVTPAPNSRVTFSTVPQPQPGNNRHDHQHHRRATVGESYAVPVGVPYPVEVQSATDADDDSDDQPGPTIFDRHGSSGQQYIPPVKDAPVAYRENSQSDPPAPESPQDPTTLVFKGGRQLEVTNYAIVGTTLYDLTIGHPRKVALADLDLDATQKLNEDRGVIFQLPPSSQAN